MIYVIGSGPTGAAASLALVDSGKNVTMLDVGIEIEPEKRKVIETLAGSSPHRWNQRLLSSIKQGITVHSGGVDNKLVFGSDYPYRQLYNLQPFCLKNAKMVQSMAKGGLSSVWGGAVLPFQDNDIRSWPIHARDLSDHYQKIVTEIGCCERIADLNERRKTEEGENISFDMCRQIRSFHEDLLQNSFRLNLQGVTFQKAGLAVNFVNDHKVSCQYCGMCLYGCPYGLIYNSASTVNKLLRRNNFTYRKNILVQRLVEEKGQVTVIAKDMANNQPVTFTGEKVFLAAGVLASTRIMLRSMNAYNRPVNIKHSEQFTLPLVRFRGVRNLDRENLHTLSQLFIEIFDAAICSNVVHLQVYAYNDFYPRVMQNMVGPFADLLRRPIDRFLGHLLIIKGYLHSDDSSEIKAVLKPEKEGDVLVLAGKRNHNADRIVTKIVRKLFRNKKDLQAIPVSFMVKIGEPGSGNHSGGSFPMKKKPKEFETDILGRPYGFRYTHIVDASVFPSIPATTITLTAMANAHRIAQQSKCGNG